LRGETTTRLSQFWPYAGDAPGSRPFFLRDDATEATGSCAAYSELMSRSQALVANDILDAYPMDAHARLLDVGGGEGRFVSEAAARFSGLALTLFDLPPVVEQAKINLARRGITSRVELIGGSFLRDPLPTDADIISLVRIVHDHDDEAALALLRAAAKALPKGGTVLIAEPMAGTRGAEPIGDAYFGFYLLAMGRGRPRRPDELEKLMLQAGFTGIHAVSTRRPMLVRIMIGKKM
jgi:demethylspheroidene O-methyltransferase